MGVGGQRHSPAALPPGMTRYLLYKRLGGPQGRSGRVLKISPPPEFDPRTVQLVYIRKSTYIQHIIKMMEICLMLLKWLCIVISRNAVK
jgi:hypothetical protein